MIDLQTPGSCSGCGACESVCPQRCIVMQRDFEGFLYPKANPAACVGCNLCNSVCPIQNRRAESGVPAVTAAYGAYARNPEIRRSSSSGGVFSVIAHDVIDKNGVVFGACFDERFLVAHRYVDTIEALEALRGSKYVQSRIGTAYADAKALLNAGRAVLFSGTPCQIAGLYAFLGKRYDNLLTTDLVCHGCPSPKVWETYLQCRRKNAGAQILSVFFRQKVPGWKNYSISLKFSTGAEYSRRVTKDPYMKGFLKNLFLRPSCHQCAFKTAHRVSDLTLADFWGVEQILPAMDDDRGTSLVLVHTKKGMAALERISQALVLHRVEAGQALRYNTAATQSVSAHQSRAQFFAALDGSDFDRLVRGLCREPFGKRIRRFLLQTYSRIKKTIFSRPV